jgi:hypothetical protein
MDKKQPGILIWPWLITFVVTVAQAIHVSPWVPTIFLVLTTGLVVKDLKGA